MALAVNGGVLYNNTEAWIEHYVLDSHTTDVYKVFLSDGSLQLEIIDTPEDNPLILDDSDGSIIYYLAVTDGILYLTSNSGISSECPNLCEMINGQGVKLISLAAEITQMRALLEGIDETTEDNSALLGGLDSAPAEWSIVG